MARKKDPKKYCSSCSSIMSRKRMNGRLEDMGVFIRRKYCDMKCMGKGHMKEIPGRHAMLHRARKFLKDKCNICGTSEKLSIHHRDRNWRNNDPSNLETLCTSCHTTLHHKAGDINPAKEKPICKYCKERKSRAAGICNTCKTRIRTHGTPFPRMKNGRAICNRLQ